MRPHEAILLCLSGVAAGAMNALAGGGTLLTFPTLLLVGIDARVANATSTVALLPGAATSLFGYRRDVASHRSWFGRLLLPSLIGGGAGSLLLLATPERSFARLAPWLVLFATLLFAAQNRRRARATSAQGDSATERPATHPLAAWWAQLGVALYGGYFGAGIGILMLVVLDALGLRDIHAMNGLKNFYGMSINAVASAVFIASGLVDWRAAGILLVGAVFGGYGGARFGRWIGAARARQAVVLLGLGATLLLLLRLI